MTTMTVEPGIKCARCGAEIYPVRYVLQIEEGKWIHTYQDDCLRHLLNRIETTEEELEAERETNEETSGFLDRLIAALDHPIRGDEVFLSEIVETAAALRARVKEAEAERAEADLLVVAKEVNGHE